MSNLKNLNIQSELRTDFKTNVSQSTNEEDISKNKQVVNNKENNEENIQSKNIVTKSFKKKEKNLQEININLKYDQDEEQTSDNLKYFSVKRKQKINLEYQDIDFLCQSQYRFTLHPFSICALNNTPNFTFNDICYVKYYTNDKYFCPICLESKLLVPIITRCGHIFCWTCLSAYNQFHSLNEKRKSKFPDCPLCKENLDKSISLEPKFCEIIESKHYSSTVIEEYTYDKILKKDKDKVNINENSLPDMNKQIFNKDINGKDNYEDDYSQMVKKPQNCSENTDINKNYDRTNSFNYKNSTTRNSEITFNLAFRSNYMIYNVNRDQNLSKFYKYYSNVSIPDLNISQANFSSLFKVTSENLNKIFEKNLLDLESGLQEELSYKLTENNRINAYISCISDLKAIIEKFKLQVIKEANKKEILSNLTSKTKDSEKRFKYFYQEKNGDIYFLHPINYLILINEFKSVEMLPTEIKVKLFITFFFLIGSNFRNRKICYDA
jgi:hypothetical protein